MIVNRRTFSYYL